MREADALERADPTLADDISNCAGALGAENETIDGESGAIVVNHRSRKMLHFSEYCTLW